MLIKRNSILLGGALAEVADEAHAAYVFRCDDVEEARRVAAEDPFALNDVVRPKCVEWQLVGVNPEAIDAEDIVRPAHALQVVSAMRLQVGRDRSGGGLPSIAAAPATVVGGQSEFGLRFGAFLTRS